MSGQPDAINITHSVDNSNQTIPNEDLVLYCAFIKKEIPGTPVYYNVVRKFIPDPGGTMVDKGGWVSGNDIKSQSFQLSWSPASSDMDNSYGVVFVQNSNTNKIYQAKTFPIYMFTGNHPINISDQVNIYPNPVSDNLVIESEYDIEFVQVFDITGGIVYTGRPLINRFIMPVGRLNYGLYFVKGTTKKGQFMSKFIKQ
jgi:hypothetical protein